MSRQPTKFSVKKDKVASGGTRKDVYVLEFFLVCGFHFFLGCFVVVFFFRGVVRVVVEDCVEV